MSKQQREISTQQREISTQQRDVLGNRYEVSEKADPVSGKDDKISIGAGTLLTPLPVIILSCGETENTNLITLAWTGIINTKPPMLSFSVRRERYSYQLLEKNKKVVVNLVDEPLTKAADFCGVKSGKTMDKFTSLSLEKQFLRETYPLAIASSPVQLLCSIVSSHELGTHTCFFATIDDVFVRKDLLNEKGAVELAKLEFVTYSHGNYYQIGEWLGFFGFSVASTLKWNDRKRQMMKLAPWHFAKNMKTDITAKKQMKKNVLPRRKRSKRRP